VTHRLDTASQHRSPPSCASCSATPECKYADPSTSVVGVGMHLSDERQLARKQGYEMGEPYKTPWPFAFLRPSSATSSSVKQVCSLFALVNMKSAERSISASKPSPAMHCEKAATKALHPALPNSPSTRHRVHSAAAPLRSFAYSIRCDAS